MPPSAEGFSKPPSPSRAERRARPASRASSPEHRASTWPRWPIPTTWSTTHRRRARRADPAWTTPRSSTPNADRCSSSPRSASSSPSTSPNAGGAGVDARPRRSSRGQPPPRPVTGLPSEPWLPTWRSTSTCPWTGWPSCSVTYSSPGVGRGPGPDGHRGSRGHRAVPRVHPPAAPRGPCRALRRDRRPGGRDAPLGALGLDRPAHLARLSPEWGRLATDDLGVVGAMTGVAVHDGWRSYRHYEVDHALCNAHHLRELAAVVSDGTSDGPTTWRDC